jgi:hypothetical protein
MFTIIMYLINQPSKDNDVQYLRSIQLALAPCLYTQNTFQTLQTNRGY